MKDAYDGAHPRANVPTIPHPAMVPTPPKPFFPAKVG
jgi:hypothetical protein